MSVPTFREWRRIKGRGFAWPRRPIAPLPGSDPWAYYCPMPERDPIFTPTEKRAGDLVLGAGGKWSAVS